MVNQTYRIERRWKKMDYWRLIIGIVGLIGVIGQMPTDWGSWVVGLAFLILAISSFSKN